MSWRINIVLDSSTCRHIKKIKSIASVAFSDILGLWKYFHIISPKPEFDCLTSGCFTDVTPVVPSATRLPGPICCADLPKVIFRLIFSPIGEVQDCLIQPLPWTFGQSETQCKTAEKNRGGNIAKYCLDLQTVLNTLLFVFYLSAAVLTLCYPWACVISVLADRMSQGELACFCLIVNVNSSDIDVFIPLCVLYSPTQKDVWLSLNSSKLLAMNFCSSGSSMLARVPPLGHNNNSHNDNNNDKCNGMIRTPDIKWVQNCLSLTKSNTTTNGICPFNQICNK